MLRKILVTGATGYLGHAIATQLKSLGHTVTAHGRNPKLCAELEKEGFRTLQFDHSDKLALKCACAGQDVVINAVGLSKAFARTQDYQAANVDFVDALIEACLVNKARLIHISSASVYCNYTDQLNVSEDHKIHPESSDYAYSKFKADELIMAAKGLQYVIFRPHLVVGPGDKKILSGLIKAHEGGPLPLFRDGKAIIDLTYIGNFVDAVVLAVETGKGNGMIFNISNGDPQELKVLLQQLFQLIDVSLKTKDMPVNFWLLGELLYIVEGACKLSHLVGFNPELFYTKYSLGLFANSFTLDISSAKKELGYVPKVSTKESLVKFADWHKKTPKEEKVSSNAWSYCKAATLTGLGFFGPAYEVYRETPSHTPAKFNY